MLSVVPWLVNFSGALGSATQAAWALEPANHNICPMRIAVRPYVPDTLGGPASWLPELWGEIHSLPGSRRVKTIHRLVAALLGCSLVIPAA
jgi:hypothetical protein